MKKMISANVVLYTLAIIEAVGMVYLAALIVGEAIIILGSMPFGYNMTDHPMPEDVAQIVAFYGYVFVILGIIFFTLKVNRLSLKDIGIGIRGGAKSTLIGLLLGAGALAVIMAILLAGGFVRFEGMNPQMRPLFFVLYFGGFLVQSSMEEVLCRGYIFHMLQKKISVGLSAAVSILFFAVFHFPKHFGDGILIGIIGCVNLVLVGVILVRLTIRGKNIGAAIGFHWIWNFLLFNVIGLNLSGLETADSLFKVRAVNGFLTGHSYGIESSVITTVVLGAVITAIILTERGRRKNGISQ